MGPEGPQGPQGDSGVAAVEIVSMKSTSSSAPNRNLLCTCPSGKRVIGGGARVIRNDGRPWEDIALVESYPSSATQWSAMAAEGSDTDAMWQLEVYVICAVTSN